MEKVVEDVWNSKDKEVRAVITLSFSKSVAFNIMNETMTPNKMNALRDILSSVGINFDNETQVALLLASLLDNWSKTITVITSSVGTSGMTFEGIRDLVLGEDIRHKNQDQKHKQNKIDLTTVIHNYWPIIQNLSSSPPTYTLVPLPVMQRKLSGSGLGA
uniref:Uncharacterized protein n=1 Tax=Lactuca sativa TaxID=4236 RepID=A0A9R1VJB4_LACSA|nr:hypothetical protein LSAT_V11C500289590 [Lactuca sativa]